MLESHPIVSMAGWAVQQIAGNLPGNQHGSATVYMRRITDEADSAANIGVLAPNATCCAFWRANCIVSASHPPDAGRASVYCVEARQPAMHSLQGKDLLAIQSSVRDEKLSTDDSNVSPVTLARQKMSFLASRKVGLFEGTRHFLIKAVMDECHKRLTHVPEDE